jgi:hypothetical protein
LSDFSAEWLTLREPADTRARSPKLTAAIAEVCAREEIVRALDLATGTAANLRFLAEQLPVPQDWLLVDHDPVLLAQIPIQMRAWAARRGHNAILDPGGLLLRGETLECHVKTRRVDLTVVHDASIFDRRTLVTASALFDLVSEPWLRTLIARCREQRAAVLFTLTYDGRMHFVPREPDDEMVRELVNRHQRCDKGFGMALGPDGAERAADMLSGAGYDVRREPSDWVLTAGDGDLQRQLIEGWVRAAADVAPERRASILSWRARRLELVADDRSQLIVGHQDVAGWPHREA